jgi:hypothetical protein
MLSARYVYLLTNNCLTLYINKNNMTSTELKDLVKAHFNLVEAEVKEETTVEEAFGELKDINGAFTLRFPGDSLQVGDKVTVVTAEGQEMDAPNGEHELEDGTKLRTEDSVVTEITSADGEKAMAEETEEEEMQEEEVKEEEMEDEAKIEDIVEAIVESVKEEMGKMKEKMAELEDKVAGLENMPAAEPTLASTGKKMEASSKFSKFNVDEARNADRIKMALDSIKNKK